MTTEPATTASPEKGTILHALATFGLNGRLVYRGQSFEVDDDLLRYDLDRNGRSAMSDMIDAGRLGLGEFPAHLEKFEEIGDAVWSVEYVYARDKARAIPDPDERRKAEAAVVVRFGVAPAGWQEPAVKTRSKWSY